MKPRELITQSLYTYIAPVLAERGFTFRSSSLLFIRTQGEFRQEITTHLNRYNMEDVSAEFYFSFSVLSAKYSRWHLKEYGCKPANNYIASEMYWNLSGWKYPRPDLAIPQNRENHLRQLIEDTLSVGLPFLEKYSDWQQAALKLVEAGWRHNEACDFMLIAGNKEEARWCLKQALLCWEKFPERTFFIGEKDGAQLRFEKHFGEKVPID